jgi:hypothetical protein
MQNITDAGYHKVLLMKALLSVIDCQLVYCMHLSLWSSQKAKLTVVPLKGQPFQLFARPYAYCGQTSISLPSLLPPFILALPFCLQFSDICSIVISEARLKPTQHPE